MSRILVIEDEVVLRSELRRLLTRVGYEVEEAGSVQEAEQHPLEAFDLILSDLRLPGESGTAILNRSANTPVVIMTSYATVESAVQAMKLGAADYISKPFEPSDLKLTISGALQSRQASETKEDDLSDSSYTLYGESSPMLQVKQRIARVAGADSTVLILGESGTGKELVAREIHAQSPRADKSFVAVNCAAIPEGLIESELFGHEQGAFTGAANRHVGLIETADKGTLFLDEIGELPISAQARLLRVLQQREVRQVGSNKTLKIDVRILAATHRDLPSMVEDRTFRQDLYYRLQVLEIELPPLRDRGEDILRLAERFLAQASQKAGRSGLVLTAAARESMTKHSWPGNVRELANAVERAVVLAETPRITPSLLRLERKDTPLQSDEPGSLSDYFTQFVLKHQDHLSETELARRLGISRKALWERRRRFNIPRPKQRP